jgi:hypothetical protein
MESKRGDSWDWDRMAVAIAEIPAPDADIKPILEDLDARLGEYPGHYRKQAEHREVISQRLGRLSDNAD